MKLIIQHRLRFGFRLLNEAHGAEWPDLKWLIGKKFLKEGVT